MISEMAQKLKEILSNTSQEEFDRDWTEIESLGFQGPSADEIVEYFSISQQTTVSYEIKESAENTLYLTNDSFYTAA